MAHLQQAHSLRHLEVQQLWTRKGLCSMAHAFVRARCQYCSKEKCVRIYSSPAGNVMFCTKDKCTSKALDLIDKLRKEVKRENR